VKPQIVMVTWNDAWSSQAGHDREKVETDHRPVVIQSVGFLVKSNRVGITLAGCYDLKDGEPSYDRVLFVPRGMVASVRTLR